MMSRGVCSRSQGHSTRSTSTMRLSDTSSWPSRASSKAAPGGTVTSVRALDCARAEPAVPRRSSRARRGPCGPASATTTWPAAARPARSSRPSPSAGSISRRRPPPGSASSATRSRSSPSSPAGTKTAPPPASARSEAAGGRPAAAPMYTSVRLTALPRGPCERASSARRRRADEARSHGPRGSAVSLTLVYIGAAARLAPAASLRALAGGVAADIEVKLIRRHPHIFAGGTASTPGEVKSRWESIKVEQEGREGIFHDVPASFPAILQARKLQQRAASVGFDWSSATEGFPKIAEEHAELAELFAEAAAAVAPPSAVDEAPTPGTPAVRDPDRHDPRVAHEVGDLLFATVNVARLLHVDPELALREASRRFERRVTAAAALAAAEGGDWSGLDLPLQEEYYQRAKAGETAAASGRE